MNIFIVLAERSGKNEATSLDGADAHPLPNMDKFAPGRRLVAGFVRRMPTR